MKRYFFSAILIIALLLVSFAALGALVSTTRMESQQRLDAQNPIYYDAETGRLAMSKQEAGGHIETLEDGESEFTANPTSNKVPLPLSADASFGPEAPPWMNERKHRLDGETHFFTIETEMTSPESVEKEIDQKAVAEIQTYIARNFGVDCAEHVHVDPAFVRKHMYSKIHIRKLTPEKAAELLNGNQMNLEDLEYNIGYAEVRCDPHFNLMIARSWQKQKRFSRLQQFGLIGLSLLALLGIAFGFFASDKATRGMYTVRLQLGSVILAMATALILWVVASQIDWI